MTKELTPETRLCDEELCSGTHYALGYCRKHYLRLPHVRRSKAAYHKLWRKTPRGRLNEQKLIQHIKLTPKLQSNTMSRKELSIKNHAKCVVIITQRHTTTATERRIYCRSDGFVVRTMYSGIKLTY